MVGAVSIRIEVAETKLNQDKHENMSTTKKG